MKKGTKICKVCGVEYPYCSTNRDTGLFRWQDVACCQEHGSQYFAEVLAARSTSSDKSDHVKSDDTDRADTATNTDKNEEPLDASTKSEDSFHRGTDDNDVFADDGGADKDINDFWYEEDFDG